VRNLSFSMFSRPWRPVLEFCALCIFRGELKMVLDVELVSKLCAPFLSGAAAWLVRKVRPPVRLVSYFGHISAFKVNPVAGSNDPPTLVHTHSVVVLNSGSKPAHNVRLTHAQLP